MQKTVDISIFCDDISGKSTINFRFMELFQI